MLGCVDVVVSREGTHLACTSQTRRHDIWRLDLLRGGSLAEAQPLITSSQLDTAPHFSPDGQRIAFTSSRTGRPEIWVVDDEGRLARRDAFTALLDGPFLG